MYLLQAQNAGLLLATFTVQMVLAQTGEGERNRSIPLSLLKIKFSVNEKPGFIQSESRDTCCLEFQSLSWLKGLSDLPLIRIQVTEMSSTLKKTQDSLDSLVHLGEKLFIANVIFCVMFGLGLTVFAYQTFLKRK